MCVPARSPPEMDLVSLVTREREREREREKRQIRSLTREKRHNSAERARIWRQCSAQVHKRSLSAVLPPFHLPDDLRERERKRLSASPLYACMVSDRLATCTQNFNCRRRCSELAFYTLERANARLLVRFFSRSRFEAVAIYAYILSLTLVLLIFIGSFSFVLYQRATIASCPALTRIFHLFAAARPEYSYHHRHRSRVEVEERKIGAPAARGPVVTAGDDARDRSIPIPIALSAFFGEVRG